MTPPRATPPQGRRNEPWLIQLRFEHVVLGAECWGKGGKISSIGALLTKKELWELKLGSGTEAAGEAYIFNGRKSCKGMPEEEDWKLLKESVTFLPILLVSKVRLQGFKCVRAYLANKCNTVY
jgi:hypothetical protein